MPTYGRFLLPRTRLIVVSNWTRVGYAPGAGCWRPSGTWTLSLLPYLPESFESRPSMTEWISSGVWPPTSSSSVLPPGPLWAVTVRFSVRPSAVPAATPWPTFEPLGHFASSAANCGAEHVFSALPLNESCLPRWTIVSLAANAGSPGVGVVASLTTSFVTFGFFFVPCFVGDIDAEIVIAGLTAELMPAPIPASARAPVTAMASFFISPPEKRWNGGGDQYLRGAKSFEIPAPRRIEHLSRPDAQNWGVL